MNRIAVLGSANMDLVVQQPRLPRPGETMFGTGFSTVAGGKGLNQAVAAARAGAAVDFIGAVGDDAFGGQLRECLVREQIGTTSLQTVSAPTGIAAISVLEDGENSIVVVPGANHRRTELDDAGRELIQRAEFVVSQFEVTTEIILDAFRHTRSHGTRTVLTPAPVLHAPQELLSLVDILIPNAGEVCELAGVENPTQAAIQLSHIVGTVVLTLGNEGALVAQAGEVSHRVRARSVRAVDTTAAGDTFVGVLVALLAAGSTMPQALEHASAAAAISVTRAGASTSMPTWDEITAAV